MSSATVDLYEDVRLDHEVKVDPEKGVLRNVKILGLESANGRSYAPKAIKEAITLYEGRKSYIDHSTGSKGRSARDTFGWFESVRQSPAGELRGDFHLLNPKSEMAQNVLAAASSKPDLYGFSHHANGTEVMRGGKRVVESIERVHSVDLVDDPATTRGLYESRESPVKTTIKEVLANSTLSAAYKAKLKEMVDAGMMSADAPADQPQAMKQGGSPEEALSAGFKAAIHAVVDDDSMDIAGKLSKIRELLKGMEKHLGGKEEPAPAPAADEAPAATEAKLLRAEMGVRDLIEDAGLKFAKPEARRAFVKSLVPLSEADRKALIEERKAHAPARTAPQTGTGRNGVKIQESTDKVPDDLKQLKSFLNR
jgi:hypothetical protein